MLALKIVFWTSLVAARLDACRLPARGGGSRRACGDVASTSADDRADGQHRRRRAQRGGRDRAARAEPARARLPRRAARDPRRLRRLDRRHRRDRRAPGGRGRSREARAVRPRGGKVSAQNRGVARVDGRDRRVLRRERGLAARRAADARPQLRRPGRRLRHRAARRTRRADGTNREGAYWRFELWLRAQESRLGSITAGNGPIYAVRRSDWVELEPWCGHDLGLPYLMVQRGRRAVYDPDAVSVEKPSRDIEDEYQRKVRMLRGAWVHVFRGMLRRVGPVYFVELVSHRLLRYGSGILHVVLLVSSAALVGEGWVYRVGARRCSSSGSCSPARGGCGCRSRARASPTTTSSSPGRRWPGSRATSASGRRCSGSGSRARGEPRARRRRRVARARAGEPVPGGGRARDQARRRRPRPLPAAAGRAGRARVRAR